MSGLCCLEKSRLNSGKVRLPTYPPSKKMDLAQALEFVNAAMFAQLARGLRDVETAWDKGEQLTAAERGEVAVAIASAKVLSTRVALNVTSKIFEVMGARSAATKYRFERYWRNVRTHTLHDPVAYKVYEVGNWILNEQIPIFTLHLSGHQLKFG